MRKKTNQFYSRCQDYDEEERKAKPLCQTNVYSFRFNSVIITEPFYSNNRLLLRNWVVQDTREHAHSIFYSKLSRAFFQYVKYLRSVAVISKCAMIPLYTHRTICMHKAFFQFSYFSATHKTFIVRCNRKYFSKVPRFERGLETMCLLSNLLNIQRLLFENFSEINLK